MDIYHTQKKAHSDQILSFDIHKETQQLICTSSLDGTIRLWDTRVFSSIKLYKCQQLKEKDINSVIFNQNFITCSAKSELISFDLLTDKVINTTCVFQEDQKTDDINQITLDKGNNYIAYCDDKQHALNIVERWGFVFQIIFRNNLSLQNVMQIYSLSFTYKPDYSPILISSGFDSIINYWDVNKKIQYKSVNLQELSQKYIQGQLLSPPLVYSIYGKKQSFLASTETGHVWAFNIKEPRKPKYVMSAHFAKVIRSVYSQFNEEKIVTIGNDKNFAIWDQSQRDFEQSPLFLKRIEIQNKPNWMDTSKDNCIYIADQSSSFHRFQIKQ